MAATVGPTPGPTGILTPEPVHLPCSVLSGLVAESAKLTNPLNVVFQVANSAKLTGTLSVELQVAKKVFSDRLLSLPS